MKEKTGLLIWELIIYGFTGWAIISWYDWKLFVILILFVWSENIAHYRRDHMK